MIAASTKQEPWSGNTRARTFNSGNRSSSDDFLQSSTVKLMSSASLLLLLLLLLLLPPPATSAPALRFRDSFTDTSMSEEPETSVNNLFNAEVGNRIVESASCIECCFSTALSLSLLLTLREEALAWLLLSALLLWLLNLLAIGISSSCSLLLATDDVVESTLCRRLNQRVGVDSVLCTLWLLCEFSSILISSLDLKACCCWLRRLLLRTRCCCCCCCCSESSPLVELRFFSILLLLSADLVGGVSSFFTSV